MALAAWSVLRVPHSQFGLKLHPKSTVCRLCHACTSRAHHTLRSRQHFTTRPTQNDKAKLSFSPAKLCHHFVSGRSLTCDCVHPRVGFGTESQSQGERLAADEKRILKKKRKEARRQERLERQQFKQKSKRLGGISYSGSTLLGEKKDVGCALPDAYDPKYVEAAWYEWWEKQGFFNPDFNQKSSTGKFVVCLPPPNVTGTLHLGHALGNSIQDAIIRWHRMCGRSVLWNPGCDHAGIATQVVVEKGLWRTQQKSRHDLGRQAFTQLVWEWKQEKGDRIYDQMRRLGSSLDWSRECFTLDPKRSRAVTEAFIRLHREGLVYRSTRLVNWSCALRSAISDIEVEDVELSGKTYLAVPGYDSKVAFGTLTSFAYPVENLDEKVVVATTRLETMLGDTGVAVHPDDPRYTHLHGRHVIHPLTQRRLPVVCDEFVSRDFGTGAVKLTPAHDPVDYEVGKKHGLEFLSVLDDRGCLVNVPEHFKGMKRFAARQAVQDALTQLGLLRGEHDHSMVLPVCSRSKDIIEPRLKDQWFVDCKDMAEQAIQAVERGELQLMPAHYGKQWSEWLRGTKTRDWCISRQLWWGHQIPAYQVLDAQGQPLECDGAPVWLSAYSSDDALQKASTMLGQPLDQLQVVQDEDVLDTWFSSALLPFSIFGWPDKTADLEQFYPTDLLETASDIIFFWVARIVMLGQKLTGQLPFKQVLFHSILRDSHGRKMSKSLGNIVDPMDVINGISLQELQQQLEQSNLQPEEVRKAQEGQRKDFPLGIPECGADALRFALCSYNYKSHFLNIDIHKLQHSRHFCNKVWQAFRFSIGHLGDDFQPLPLAQLAEHSSPTDMWMLSRLSSVVEACHSGFTTYDLNLVTEALHSFWWMDLCDVYLEYCKPILQCGDEVRITATKSVLHACIDVGLRCLSPFMPYLTEELYQRLPGKSEASETVCLAAYPHPRKYDWRDTAIEGDMTVVKEICGTVQSLRRDFNMRKRDRPQVFLEVDMNSTDVQRIIADHHTALQTLSQASDVVLLESGVATPGGCVIVDMETYCRVHMQVQGVIDVGSELQRLQLQQQKLSKEMSKMLMSLERDGDDSLGVGQEKMNSVKSQLERTERAISALKQLHG